MAFERIQELENRLAAAASKTEEIDALNALALELVSNNTERADSLAQRALEFSRVGDPAGQPYTRGTALSLSILGEIAKQRCNYQAGLKYLLEAQSVLEISPNQEIQLLVWRDLGWIYFNIGDLPQAIEILHKALRIAREQRDPGNEARILNTLGAVYGESGNKEESIKALRRALKYTDGTDENRLRCLILNNLAMTQFEIQDYTGALDSADRSLEIARQLAAPDLLATGLDTSGQIYLAMKEYVEAEGCLNQALAYYRGEGNDPDEIKLNLARAAIGQARLDEAAGLLSQSLVSAEARSANRFSFQCHELLAQVCEEKGDLLEAIEHYKKFHAIKTQVYNQDTRRRLGNLMVSQQAETSSIDAEIYRLKNLALRKEISDHRVAAAEMKVLATTDALTGLLNRRHLMTLGGYAFDFARREGQPLSVLMMDVDNFKQVNDLFGHLAGDRVLIEVSAAIQAGLRKDDLLGRFGGEEFVAVLPKAGISAVQKVAERVLRKVAQRVTRVRSQDIQITLSIGIAHAEPADECLETLLERADQALYAAKRAGKNRAMATWEGNPSQKSSLFGNGV